MSWKYPVGGDWQGNGDVGAQKMARRDGDFRIQVECRNLGGPTNSEWKE